MSGKAKKRKRDSKGRFVSKSAGRGRVGVGGGGHRGYPDSMDVSITRGGFTRFGYKSARQGLRESRGLRGGSGSEEMVYDRLRTIYQSREFQRDNPIYQGMVNRAVAYIIGTGFNLKPLTKDPETNKTIEKLWRGAWRRPEVREVLSGVAVEKMVCRELIVAGDNCAALVGDKVQIFEAEQMTSGLYPEGIKTDDKGKPEQYYVAPYSNGQVDRGRAKKYDPKHFIFVTDPDRPSSLRTVPPLQAAFAMLHRINDVCDSSAIAFQMMSRLAFAVKRLGGAELANQEAVTDPNAIEDSIAQKIMEFDTAIIFNCDPGEEIDTIDRKVPGEKFSESLRMFLRLLGLPLGLPLELILLDWTESNYSQSRAVLEQAYQTFRGWQELIGSSFLNVIYERHVRRWLHDGLIDGDIDDLLRYIWIAPSFPWIDQLKEVQAASLRVERSFSTMSTVCKSLGTDYSDVLPERVKEITEAIEAAKAIEKATKVEVDWRYLTGLRVEGGEMDTAETNSREPGGAGTE